MSNYLKDIRKIQGCQWIKDYIDDEIFLRHYHVTQQFAQMQDHVHKLTLKYPLEAITWNTVNCIMPNTYEQAYINAENFLQVQGAIIVVTTMNHYVQHLTEDEAVFVESMINAME